MCIRFKFVCAVMLCGLFIGLAQSEESFLIGSRRCVLLPNHAAVQECQALERAEVREWGQQMQKRYVPPPPRFNEIENKSPMNCFKRASTGEQVCAN